MRCVTPPRRWHGRGCWRSALQHPATIKQRCWRLPEEKTRLFSWGQEWARRWWVRWLCKSFWTGTAEKKRRWSWWWRRAFFWSFSWQQCSRPTASGRASGNSMDARQEEGGKQSGNAVTCSSSHRSCWWSASCTAQSAEKLDLSLSTNVTMLLLATIPLVVCFSCVRCVCVVHFFVF